MLRTDDRSQVASFVRQTRSRLRTRVLWGTVLTVLIPVLPAVVAVSAVPQLGFLGWGMGGAIVLMALAWKAQQLPSDTDAARWLDDRLSASGLVVAAEHCSARGLETDEASTVLAQAVLLLQTSSQGRRSSLPTRPLIVRAALALGLTGTVLAAVLALPGSLRSGGFAGGVGMATAVPTPEEEAQQALESRLDPQTAQMLRNQPQMSALAEQALASGDLEGLKSMLDQAQAGGREPNPSEPTPSSEKARNQPPPASPESEQKTGQPPTQQPVTGSNQDGKAPPQPGTPGSQQQQTDPGKDSQPGGNQSRDSKDGPSDSPMTEAPSPSGKGTGTGHSDARQGQVEAKARAKTELKSADPFTAGLFEIKLPGQDAKMSLQQALAATTRSAEAALQSSTAPLEYESAVRDYFLTLSHKEQP